MVQNTYILECFSLKVVWLRTVLHDVIHSFHSPSTRYHWMSSWLCRLLTLNSVLPDRNEGRLSPGVQQRRSVVLLIINQSQSSTVSWIVNLTSISESDWLSAASSVSVLAVSSVTLPRSGWDLNISLLARLSSSSLLLVSASSAWILSSTFPGLWRVTEEPTGGETFGTDWKYWDYNNQSMLLHLQLQICPYFIDLWFSQLNNGLSRLLECCHFASVCNEGLHDSWSGRQNDWSVQVWIKPLLARKKNRLYPGTFVVGAGMFHLTRFFSSHYKWPECNDEKEQSHFGLTHQI